eukprot:Colp12_sorted_trinity150504_noHs@2208
MINLEEMRKQAFAWCTSFVHGWKHVPLKEFIFDPVKGGLTNSLYKCQVPARFAEQSYVPKQVLLRIYGKGTTHFLSREQDIVTFAILAERKLGPALYGIFPEGRLEEFLPHRNLITVDLQNPDYSVKIAKNLARFHSYQMPFHKEPVLFENIYKWLAEAKHVRFDDDDAKKALLDELWETGIEREIPILQDLCKKANSPIVFCHNDLQEGNIMVDDESTGHLQFVDFEYGNHNYRGFDFGNHFCEFMLDYNGNPDYPGYLCMPQNWPTKQQQELFLGAYLEQLRTDAQQPDSLLSPRQAEQLTLHQLTVEANTFALGSHLMWAIWSIVQARQSEISFGYLEYALDRMRLYHILKPTVEAYFK